MMTSRQISNSRLLSKVAIIMTLALSILVGVVSGFGLLPNPVLTIITAAILLLTTWAFIDLQKGLLIFVVTVVFIELAKRLLFIVPPVEQSEYLLVKGLPTLILVGLVLNLFLRRVLIHGATGDLFETRLDRAVLLFLLWSILTSFNPRQPLAVGIAALVQIALPISMYFIGRSIVDRRFLTVLIQWIVSLGLLAAMYGYKQGIWGLFPFEGNWILSGLSSQSYYNIYLGGEYLRTFSTFASRKEFGFYLAMCSILAITFLTQNGKRAYGLILLGIFLPALILSLHRASWVILVSGIAIMIWIRRLRGRWLQVPLVALFAAPFLVPLVGPLLLRVPAPQAGFLHAALRTGTFASRLEGWSAALAQPGLFFDPIGQGLGNSFIAGRLGTSSFVPHSGLLELSLEQGLVGVIIFGYVLYIWWSHMMQTRSAIAASDQSGLILAMIGIVFGLLVTHAVINSFTHMYPATVFFWFLMGVTSKMLQTDSNRTCETT